MTTNIRLSEATADYMKHLQARGLALNTAKANATVLSAARRIWGDIYVASIRPEHIDRLFSEGGWAESTRNTYLANLRLFFRFARRHGYMRKDFDPCDGWRNIRVPDTERLWLPAERFGELLDHAAWPRDRAVIAIGLYTFLRGSEISWLRIQDVDFKRHQLRIYRLKTKQDDLLPISMELAEELTLWMNLYERECGKLQPDWYLTPKMGPLPTFRDTRGLVRPTGQPGKLNPRRPFQKPYEAVKRSMAAMGLDPHGNGNHLTRRSGARALYDELVALGHDGALKRVSSMLGHSNTAMTERYLSIRLERKQRNEAIGGKVMFPSVRTPSQVIRLGDRRAQTM